MYLIKKFNNSIVLLLLSNITDFAYKTDISFQICQKYYDMIQENSDESQIKNIADQMKNQLIEELKEKTTEVKYTIINFKNSFCAIYRHMYVFKKDYPQYCEKCIVIITEKEIRDKDVLNIASNIMPSPFNYCFIRPDIFNIVGEPHSMCLDSITDLDTVNFMKEFFVDNKNYLTLCFQKK
ncbi:hypothetical protein AB837_00394 [bacterium AB1]|nr:hypothetical protein AB837_00394 [bacterium AB1]